MGETRRSVPMGAEMDERSGGDAGTPHRGTLTRAFPFKKNKTK